jgi:hypothetical protein
MNPLKTARMIAGIALVVVCALTTVTTGTAALRAQEITGAVSNA